MSLLWLHQGKTMSEVSKLLKYAYPSVIALKKNFLENGCACLEEKSRSGRLPLLDGLAKAKITALACSTAPEGHARWSLRLLADKAVELELAEAIVEKMPEWNLLDILSDVEFHTKFTRHFGPLSSSNPKLEKPVERYLLTMCTYGCNLGPAQSESDQL